MNQDEFEARLDRITEHYNNLLHNHDVSRAIKEGTINRLEKELETQRESYTVFSDKASALLEKEFNRRVEAERVMRCLCLEEDELGPAEVASFCPQHGNPRMAWLEQRLKVRELESIAASLAEALEVLISEQNGPPLIRHEESWQRAMNNATDAMEAFERHKKG